MDAVGGRAGGGVVHGGLLGWVKAGPAQSGAFGGRSGAVSRAVGSAAT
ncbi:hypothetical protein SLNWT_6149 [Streptomyces albus]|uniref:Uncharacterized protein n=1 Tax=Streptomyces albus (strain ATCC 21838 / DSM 41398 / FERM P-419 / JCM 4703 / NBRC 107858) TaxID=1081613 RepID=A0A0B5F4K3_STRA4|nr:hypothetical protein SLNWT_6149 [Streptomyces albus]AOU80829.1 hypothetical protein SLNHY_6138 [Streptomyces albus]